MIVTETEGAARPLPPLQAEMAGLIEAGEVFYSRHTARWYLGATGTDEIGRERGRALRTLASFGMVVPDLTVAPDVRRARPMRLTAAGRERLAVSPDTP